MQPGMILAICVFATIGLFGVVVFGAVAINYKGFANLAFTEALDSVKWLRRIPPWRWFPEPGRIARWSHRAGVGFMGLVVSPVTSAIGIHATLTGGLGGGQSEAQSAPEWEPMNLLVGVGVLAFWTVWLSRTRFVRVARQSGRIGRGVIVFGFLGMILGAAGIGLLSPALGMLGWVVVALAVVVFVLSGMWQGAAAGIDITLDDADDEYGSVDPGYRAMVEGER